MLSAKIAITATRIKRLMLMKLIIDEMFFSSSSLFFEYLMKIGMNAELKAPVISISKTKSGNLKDAKKISSCSLVKKLARVR